jgi:type IV pilus assembly protein PilW
MKNSNPAQLRPPARGFSLIEMMVAIVIGIILSIGLVQVMVAGKTAAQATQGANFMQENARFATSQLDYSIQMAGALGPAKPTTASHSNLAGGAAGTPGGRLGTILTNAGCGGVLTATYNGTDNKDPEAFWTLGIVGLDTTASVASLGASCLPDPVPNAEAIVLRYADSNFLPCTGTCLTVPTTTDGTTTVTSCCANGLFVRVAVGANAILMTGAEVIAPGSNALYTAKYSQSPTGNQDGLYTFPYRLEIYYVRKCSNPAVVTACATTDDNGNEIPSLWRRRLTSDGTLALEPVVEGVEMLHFEYGMAANYVVGSGIPTIFSGVQTYESATQVGVGGGADDWVGIVAARVSIMAQGDAVNSTGTRGNVAQQALQGGWNMTSNPSAGAVFTPSYPTPQKAALLQHTIYTTVGNSRNQNRG